MNQVVSIEREFGVPIPGEILHPSRWTQTALKKMPAEGHLNWSELFGRDAPVVLDLGCGNGRYLIGSALLRSDHDHLGIDTLPVVVRYARRRGNQRGLANLKFAVGCGLDLLYRYVAPLSVAEIHCYHPQPYYDPELVHKRLITRRRLLQAGGIGALSRAVAQPSRRGRQLHRGGGRRAGGGGGGRDCQVRWRIFTGYGASAMTVFRSGAMAGRSPPTAASRQRSPSSVEPAAAFQTLQESKSAVSRSNITAS